MDLGDVVQAATFSICDRIVPERAPLKGAVCGGLAVAGHVAGDLAQPIIARNLGSVLVSISHEGREMANTTAGAVPSPSVPAQAAEGYPELFSEIAGGWLGQELAKSSCEAATSMLPSPISTASAMACETVASYIGGKAIPKLAQAYLAHFHPPLEP